LISHGQSLRRIFLQRRFGTKPRQLAIILANPAKSNSKISDNYFITLKLRNLSMALELQVASIVCDGCVNTVTQAIQSVDNAASVAVDLASKIVSVSDNTADRETIIAAIAATGHTVS
jgi:copper chaperone